MGYVLTHKLTIPSGMLVPTRYGNTPDYRYGFIDKEKDNEVKGDGNSYDFGARIYDPRIGRFLSIDPLFGKYPELTPYQFSSNTPIWATDLDGLEGVSYRVVRKDETTGKAIPIKRVIEADIYIAVNAEGTCGAYTPEEKNNIFMENSKKYNANKFKDDEGLAVEFLFNYKKNLILNLLTLHNLRRNCPDKTPTLYTNPGGTTFETRKGGAIWNEEISSYGRQSASSIRINPKRGPYAIGHAESHEIGLFLLMGEGYTRESPKNDDENDHGYQGIMTYVVTTITKEDDGSTTTSTPKPDNTLSKRAFKMILKAVPKVEDKVESPISQ